MNNEKRKRVRSNTKQITILTDYMAAHPRLANNEFNGPQGKAQREQQWQALRTILKEHGPDKTPEQWEHTWRDLRRNARNTGARNRSALRATGNVVDVPEISSQVLKILGTIGLECAIGISGAEETGVGSVEAFPESELLPQATQSESEPLPWATVSEPLTHSAESEPLSSTPRSEPFPQATRSEPLPRATRNEPLPRATRNEPLHHSAESEPLPSTTRNEHLPQATRSEPFPQATRSEPLPRATRNEPLPHSAEREPFPQATRYEPFPRATAQRRRQGLGTRAADFLQAELQTNNVLADISQQLVQINNQLTQNNNLLATSNGVRVRMMFRERMWRLRNKRFTS